MRRESTKSKTEITLKCEYCGYEQIIPLTQDNAKIWDYNDVICTSCNRHTIKTPAFKRLDGLFKNPDYVALRHGIFPFIYDIVDKKSTYEIEYLTLPCYHHWIEQSYPDEYKNTRLRAIRLFWWVSRSPEAYYNTSLYALELLGVYKRFLKESKSGIDYLTLEYCIERNDIDKVILDFIYKGVDAESNEEKLVVQTEVNAYIEQELKEDIVEKREKMCMQTFDKIAWGLYKFGKTGYGI